MALVVPSSGQMRQSMSTTPLGLSLMPSSHREHWLLICVFEGNKKGNLLESTVECFPQIIYFRQKIQLSWLTFCRFTVLCASSSGRLQLLDLQHQEHLNMRSLPLLPPARPVHLTVHPSKAVLVVACQGSDKLWELRCMSPVTGALSLSLVISHHHHLS